MKGHTFKRCSCPVVRDPIGRRLTCRKRHGTWWYAYELPPGSDGVRRRVREGGFLTEREAAEAMTQSMVGLRGHVVPETRSTVAEYLDRWLASKASLRSSTRRSYAEHIRLYLKPGLGHRRLVELGDTDVDQLYTAMRQLGQPFDGHLSDTLSRLCAARSNPSRIPALTDARIRRVHATLLSALNGAVKRRLIPLNPALHVELPRGRRPRAVVWTDERVRAWRLTGRRPAVAVWTAAQVGAFLDGATHDRLYPLFHLIAYRGLRRGEAVGLRWEDLDLTAGSLQVSQQVVQLGWATEIGPPKTESGARTVSLDRTTCQVLGRWRDLQWRESEPLGTAARNGLVFTREDGSPLHPDLATDRFAQLARRAGLPPIRLHDLRHTAASLALQAGIPMKVVSEQLGHSSLAITADTYTSVLPAVARAAAEAVAEVIPRRPRDPFTPAPATIRPQSRPGEASVRIIRRESPQVRGGGPRGNRTHNPRIKSPLLYRLS